MPAEQQIEAITKKLMELNPGFDGKVSEYKRNLPPKFVGGVVSEYGFNATNVTDLSPVRASRGMKALRCSTAPGPRRGPLSDLSPLKGIPKCRIESNGTTKQ